MQRTLSRTLVMLLLLSLGGTFPAVSEQERVTITWFQSLDSKAAASMQSMEESPTWHFEPHAGRAAGIQPDGRSSADVR